MKSEFQLDMFVWFLCRLFCCKMLINVLLVFIYRIMETAPTLPDFALALKPDEYQLPSVDASWSEDRTKSSSSHITGNQR